MYFSLAPRTAQLPRRRRRPLGADVAGSGVDAFSVIPDFLNITTGIDLLRGTPVSPIGAQDASWLEDFGALTGEVVAGGARARPAPALVEIGHAERRRMFAEDDIVTAPQGGGGGRATASSR